MISIIIPTYNRGYIISRAVLSVLSQSFTDFELIVVDDGSTDDTKQILGRFSDSRIKYFYKQNGGASSARNFGIDKAGGEFIALLDSDDFWPEDYLTVMIKALTENAEYTFAYCLTDVKNPDGSRIPHDSCKRCFSGNITANLFVNSVIWPSALVFRKSSAEGICFDTQLKNAEDSDFILKLSTKGRGLFVKNLKVARTSSTDSLSKSAGINCGKILVLERFYFRGGGDKFISKKIAFKKIGRSYYRIARQHQKINNKKAALYLYKKAIEYWPFDLRFYIKLIKSLFLNNDNFSDWQMPEALK